MIEFVINHGWVAWLALALLFLVVEMLTLEFTGLMLATASLGGVIAGLTPMPFWAQVVLVALLALILILFLRPPLLRWLKRDSDTTKSNVDALIGLSGTVIAAIPQDGVGTVKLSNGDTWTASFAPATLTVLVPGQPIIVTQISGATAVVRPATTAEETL